MATNILFDHEDCLNDVLSNFAERNLPDGFNGQVPVYLYYDADNEAYFVSAKPISVANIQPLLDEMEGDASEDDEED